MESLLDDLTPLRQWFNASAAVPRFLAILSPT